MFGGIKLNGKTIIFGKTNDGVLSCDKNITGGKSHGIIHSRRTYLLHEARRLVIKNMSAFIIFSLFLLIITVGIKYTAGIFFDVISVNTNTVLRSVLCDIMTLTLIIPILYIFYGFAVCLYEGENNTTAVMSGLISSSSAGRSYGLFFIYTWRYAVFYAAGYVCLRTASVAFDCFSQIGESRMAVISIIVLTAVGILILTIGSLLLNRVYLTLHIAQKNAGMSLREATAASKCAMRRHKREALVFKLSFIWLAALSFLIPFALAALIVIPYYIAANAVFGCYIYGLYERREQTIN
jgi:hypothetical protein